jgi:hypothetical protein
MWSAGYSSLGEAGKGKVLVRVCRNDTHAPGTVASMQVPMSAVVACIAVLSLCLLL